MDADKGCLTLLVLACDLPAVQIGDIVGRHEHSDAEGRVTNRWLPATTATRITRGWGESWNNACRSTGPRALYRVIALTPPVDDPPYTPERVHGFAVLELTNERGKR